MIEADVAPSNFTDAVPPNKSLGSHQEGSWGVGLLKRAGPGREEGGAGREGRVLPGWAHSLVEGAELAVWAPGSRAETTNTIPCAGISRRLTRMSSPGLAWPRIKAWGIKEH